jgi:quercetin dioxygenase-like cupin family protein
MQEVMHLTRSADARTTATPNAVMTTLASPSQNGTERLSLWKVEMTAGKRGPLHVFDHEQAWTVLSGEAAVTVDGSATTLSVGDTVVIPAGATRQIEATADLQAIVTGGANSVVQVPGEEAPRGTPPWVA